MIPPPLLKGLLALNLSALLFLKEMLPLRHLTIDMKRQQKEVVG